MQWPLQDAKNQFSKVVRRAQTEGPQVVTVRGERAVVILSVRDYEGMRSTKPTLVDHLLSGPKWDDEMVEVVGARSKRPSRGDVDF